MDIEDSYIVRILRYPHPQGEGEVNAEGKGYIGYVEHPGSGRRHGFRTMDELWAVLAESVPVEVETGKNETREK